MARHVSNQLATRAGGVEGELLHEMLYPYCEQ